MKINNQDLRRLYQSFVEAGTSESRTGCPSLETILESFDPKTSRKKKRAVVAHLSSCAHCTKEFDFLRRVLDHERNLIETLYDIQEKPPSPPFVFRRNAWRYVSAALIMMVVIGGILILKKNNELPDMKRGQPCALRLIQPLGETPSSSPLIFKWKKLKGPAAYIVEIYDEALRLVWEGPGVSADHLSLPPSVKEKLEKNKTYFWAVTAIGRNGKSSESALRSFALTE